VTTDLASWKISNGGHISTIGRPIHFLLGSDWRFSVSLGDARAVH